MDIFVKYRFQASAYDFAYSKQEDYAKRTWGQHLGVFTLGGTAGAFVDRSFINNGTWDSDLKGNIGRSGMGLIGVWRGVHHVRFHQETI